MMIQRDINDIISCVYLENDEDPHGKIYSNGKTRKMMKGVL